MRVLLRSLTAFVVFTIASLTLASPAGAVDEFGDVEAGRWYTEPIAWLVSEGITTGTSDGCFSPYTQVSRGEVVTFLFRLDEARGNDPVHTSHPFEDIERTYQQLPVGWAFAADITTGTGPATFSPDAAITRGDFAVLLWRYAGRPVASSPVPFGDVDRAYQQPAIAWMAETGITTGTSPTTFTPDGNMTRAEAATFFHRFMDQPVAVQIASASLEPVEPATCLAAYESVLVDAGLLATEAACVAPFLVDLDIDSVVAIINGTVPLEGSLIDVLSDIITAGCIPTVDRQAALIRAFF